MIMNNSGLDNSLLSLVFITVLNSNLNIHNDTAVKNKVNDNEGNH